MTIFNWLTADTKKSIMSSKKVVYLTLPNGDEPIKSIGYDGSGYFNGFDLFGILAAINFNIQSKDVGKSISLGELFLINNNYLCSEVEHSNEMIQIIKEHLPKGSELFEYCFDSDEIEINGKAKSIRKFVNDGTLTPVKIKDIVPLKYPFKFSFSSKSVYEKLPESEMVLK